MAILSSYLFQVSDPYTYEWILEGINDVLSGKLNSVERDTEWFGANITYSETTFYTTLDEEDKSTNVISTKDFKSILILWWREKESFEKWKQGQIPCR